MCEVDFDGIRGGLIVQEGFGGEACSDLKDGMNCSGATSSS